MRIFYRLANSSTALIRVDKGKSKTVRASTFVDQLKLRVIGGKGGDGCVAFTKHFAKEYAGPDGGNGGNGGHVIFQPTKEISSLANIPSIVRADNGEPGKADNCDGKNASPTIIRVPEGTLIRNSEDRKLIIDLIESPFLAARGGLGGKGNKFFTTAVNQSPMICEYGSRGEIMNYFLEMAVIAHVGLVGYPNAGKSTLLSALTRARPKVASYPFTTLKPNVGIIPFDDFSQIRVADIPGLIEGAWRNKGLGHEFLRHIQRCVCLIYIIDLTWDPEKQLQALKNELNMYDPTLTEKPSIVVGNKIDLEDAQMNSNNFRTDLNISGKHSVNLKALISLVKDFYDESKEKTSNILL
ncbi:unnamed protein product [Allacma fusca]|uniref:Uncharacterized protein n=1 Tax=Allacma fusca TaxID=39272 RepID=A0A8J2K0V4_9HEXA|nr:unnamed protein product [Allacma fusca]